VDTDGAILPVGVLPEGDWLDTLMPSPGRRGGVFLDRLGRSDPTQGIQVPARFLLVRMTFLDAKAKIVAADTRHMDV
jgi:hypothetical protein